MSDLTPRAERRAQSRSRSRAGLVIGAVVVVAIAVVAGVLVLAGGDDSGGGGASSHPVANTNVTLKAGEVTADSAGPPISVSPELTDQVIKSIGTYLEVASVEPLRTAKPVGDLSGVFDARALGRVNTVDRPALVDEGLPEVTGDLDVVATPVAITGLGDQSGTVVLLTAAIDLDISGSPRGAATPLHIVRRGSFVFTPDPSGAWKVSAYKIDVSREGGGIDAPTTTTAGTGK